MGVFTGVKVGYYGLFVYICTVGRQGKAVA